MTMPLSCHSSLTWAARGECRILKEEEMSQRLKWKFAGLQENKFLVIKPEADMYISSLLVWVKLRRDSRSIYCTCSLC